MGCASSKDKRCRHCHRPYSPVPRSYSMHVHHPAQHRGDSYHVVALTSTTLGSLKLDSVNQNNHQIDITTTTTATIYNNSTNKLLNGYDHKNIKNNDNVRDKEEQSKGSIDNRLIEAKVWSNMMEDKIPKIVPKTPIRTPPGEPETINTWELMEGLEDISPFRSPNHLRSFSFDVCRSPRKDPFDCPKSRFHENESVSPKPLWLQMADDESNSSPIPEFDPEVISTFRKSLEELSPQQPFYNQAPDSEMKGNDLVSDYKCPPLIKDKLIVYFTSLRGVRKTYEDCCHVRVILKGLGVRVDERDVSMHSGFKDELKELLGDGFKGGGLPRVFLGRKYIGGAEEIRRMHEEGQLEKLLEGCEMVDDDGGGNGGTCEACGDIRFVPCETCSGSCKVYYECDNEEEEEEEGEEAGAEGEYGFQRCPDCNENGLVRCAVCCY